MKYTRLGVDVLTNRLRDYASKYIITDYFSSDIVEEGRQLNKAVATFKSKTLCQSHIEMQKHCRLDYWDEMVRLVQSRIATINKTSKTKTSCCENYNTVRFFNTGLPMVVYPSKTTTIVKQLTLLFMAVSGIVQFVRVQIDGGLSFWSQIIYLLGCACSVAYYASTNNLSLIIPQLGAFALTLVTVWGLLRNVEQPWASL